MHKLSAFIVFIFILAISSCRESKRPLFDKMSAATTNINFTNTVIESDSINPIKMEFLYNGGGVAVGDFNNDSLEDLYFTASTSSNKLYLNKGNFEFQDVTQAARVTGEGCWSNGATVVDINNDGLKDIYVSTSIRSVAQGRKNLLYVNLGIRNGTPTFRESAGEYGLADTSFSVQSVFFDYDKDGDLDMYLATTKPTSRNIHTFGRRKDSTETDFDKLFRNDWDSARQHPVFTDVSREAGIQEKGYGLGVTVADINNDGWPDIYVTNDFLTGDHLYMNNRNGSFSNKIKECLKHTSQNAMGNDVSDINNDGWPDLVAVDMNPEDNFRKQKNMSAANYGKYRNMSDFNYSLQFVRNTLQINQGPADISSDTILPLFSDISYYAGVAETDWSWSPSIADFDNDGMKDLLITNGYPKDVTDHDYISYRQDKGYIVTQKTLLDQIPEIKVANYAFRNGAELKFQNVSKDWGLDDLAYSTGAVYADLDNDGDLDYVINNINSPASVYRNTLDPGPAKNNNYLIILFEGAPENPNGIGAKATVIYDGLPHVFENYPTRGYLSCMSTTAHFGLAGIVEVEDIVITWPNGHIQSLGRVKANQTLRVKISDAHIPTDQEKKMEPLFTKINKQSGVNFVHSEYDFIDFDYQRLLPHKLSEFGPALASGDLDGNGLDDFYSAGPRGKSGMIFLQQPNGKFTEKPLQQIAHPARKPWEETGVFLFDLDNDADLDLYLCSGSVEQPKGDTAYRDRIFTNDGKSNFTEVFNTLPRNLASKQVIKAADYDNDGDVDLFIGGRSIPNEYPKPASGYIYRNDSGKGQIKFTDVTMGVAAGLINIGLISDALWTDFNRDGQSDLILCGEFMPVTFLMNKNGRFTKSDMGVGDINGLFNSITSADVNNDGQLDYIVGNLGLNSFYRATSEAPFSIYASDFDNNGSLDAIPFLFLKDADGKTGQFPAFTRDDMFKQMPRIKGQFPTYRKFAESDVSKILTEDERKFALYVSANYTQSAILMNGGNGKFTMKPLPFQVQWSPVYGILADDYNRDGNIDLLLCTNDFGTEVNTGQYDALNGLCLLGNGDGDFRVPGMLESGFCIPSNGKAIVKFVYQGKYAVAVSQNRAALELFHPNYNDSIIRIAQNERVVEYHLKKGGVRREELHIGSTFLSQSARFIQWNESIASLKIYSANGEFREIPKK